MPFGTENLQYGEGLGDTDFGAGGQSVYDEYMGDAYVSEDVDVGDYLYEYDPLKEQNLLADYMSGLMDFGDKTEGVRTKAIAERKALSKSIRGGLATGTMESMAEEGMDAASRAQASLYRGQAAAKRGLGEDIGSLREAYEGDIAQGVLDYNQKVGEGMTAGEIAAIPSQIDAYLSYYSFTDTGGRRGEAIQAGAPSGDYAQRNAGYPANARGDDDEHNDSWLDTSSGNWYQYDDPNGMWGTGDWKGKGQWTAGM